MDGVFFNSVPRLPDICLIFGSIVYIVLFQLLLVSYFIVHIYIYIFRLLFLHLPIIVFAFANSCIYIFRLLFLHFPIVVFIFPDCGIYISQLLYSIYISPIVIFSISIMIACTVQIGVLPYNHMKSQYSH